MFPTTAKMCNLEIPDRIQGKDISELLRHPQIKVRENILSANNKGWVLQGKRWSYSRYKGKAPNEELFDLQKDPKQYTNLIKNPEYLQVIKEMRTAFQNKIKAVKTNDLK